MGRKLASILRNIEEIKTFTDESYLRTSFFAVFLLFGCAEQQRELLISKANELIADRQAFAMIDISDSSSAVSLVRDAIEKASDDRIDVDDLNEMHLCPVIISENADISVFSSVITAVDAYIKKRDIQPVWKVFLLLDALSGNAAEWLDSVSENIRALGSMRSCRCCVLTRKDEKGFGVAEERLLTTVLFVAFLHLVKQTREEIGRYIGLQRDKPGDLFYTAQTVFVENPVITRIFNRMSGLLDRLCQHSVGSRDIDMGFIHETLKTVYRNMPGEREAISLLPIYSVMPCDNIEDFKKRLKSFAMAHYLSITQDDPERKAIFDRIESGFLRSCVQAGLGINDLVSLVGNTEKIDRLASVQAQGISIDHLPPYPGSGKNSSEISGIFDSFDQWLRKRILGIGSELLVDYFQSGEFAALPKKYRNVQEKLSDEIMEMTRIKNQRKKLDIALRLLNDPDEKWLDDIYEASERDFVQQFTYMALAKDDETFDIGLSELLDKLYHASKGLTGGGGARAYMELVSETCADSGSDIAKSCIAAIGDALRFPIRVSGNFGGEASCTYVWGSMDNNLYHVWEKYHTIIDTKSVELPIKSNERFAFLRVSASFNRAGILSIGGGGEG